MPVVFGCLCARVRAAQCPMSKRHRDDGNAAPDLDPHMLRDAQHKALTISLQRYKLSIDELEAKLQATQRTNTSLTDVVSLLGRQLVAVRRAPPL